MPCLDMSDSFRVVQPIKSFKHSNKDCDWLTLACFIRVQMHADATSVRSENEVCLENEGECGGK